MLCGNVQKSLVSVPYWGSLSSNAQLMKDKNALKTEFPSPTGVLYLLITMKRWWKEIEEAFPSPTGVLYLLIGWNLEAKTLFGMFPSPTGVLYLLILI